MWIRSQDKKVLINSNGVFLLHCVDSGITELKDFDSGMVLAEYQGNRKALKVMDMMQKTIVFSQVGMAKTSEIADTMEYWDNYGKSIVFQMPQDEEVE